MLIRIAPIMLVVCLLPLSLLGCKDRYQEGYEAGYADATDEVTQEMRAKCESEVSEAREESCSYSYSSVVTETCGGAGVNFNGKYISPGKTGCVRVYSDGRIERY